MKTRELRDKAEILAYLETDRVYAAYAIGDLEPGMFEHCTWAGAEDGGRLQSLALFFYGLEFPILFMVGDTGGLRAILGSEDEDVPRPEYAYITCRTEHLAMTREFFDWEVRSMWRMWVQPADFRPVEGQRVRLLPADADRLAELYSLGGVDAFSPVQMERGVFYGVLTGGEIVAAAGTHLVSPTYGVAAVGNVFTHPDYRRRGYGTATISAVVAELLQRGIRDVVLNVGQDNASAIRIYERLGFERYCRFLEGSAVRRPGGGPRPS